MLDRETIVEKIRSIVGGPQNNLELLDEPAFGQPMVRFGRGDDPLLDFFREDIGAFYKMPNEWLEKKYNRPFDRSRITLISWGLPQTEHSREENSKEELRPAYPWALNRTYGEAFQRSMAKQIEDWLDERGIAAIAPMSDPDFRWEESEKYGLASGWSERHTAFLCGIGTFGLCDGLISPLGKAMRYGSVIAEISLPTDERPYTRYNEYCLADEGCDACIRRCPAGTITREGGHDKKKCYDYQMANIVPWCKENYGFDGSYGCGLCQTGVPCEKCIPPRRERR